MGNINTGRIHETAIWVDFEGGHATHQLWDATMVIDTVTSKPTATRLVTLPDKSASRSKLKNSLPISVFDKLRKNRACKIHYELQNGKWTVMNTLHSTKSVGTMFAESIPNNTAYVLAWNMKAHDAKILGKIVPKKQLDSYQLLDPLKWFRKHFTLPSNSLGKAGAGTPRHTMKAGDYGYLGKSHTSLVDTLHMRDVTLNAAVSLRADDTHQNPTFKDVETAFIKDDPKSPRKSSSPTVISDGNDWMWNKVYWDDNQNLIPATSKEYKRRFIQSLKKLGREPSKASVFAINASKKKATFQKYLT